MKRLMVLLAAMTLVLAACFDTPTEKAVRALDRAVEQLAETSASWQAVLAETRDELIDKGQSTIAHEVDGVLSRATADIGVEARCYTDFLRQRVREEISGIKAKLLGETFELVPVFCNPTPSSIDMNIEPARRPLIEIAGYNLTRDAVRASIESAGGQVTDVSQVLDNPTGYLVTVNVNRLPIQPDSVRLIFSLGLNPVEAATRSIAITPKTVVAPPNYVASTVHVVGTVDLNDKETFGSDENRRFDVDTRLTVLQGTDSRYHWQGCVGDEVQGYIDATLTLNKSTGTVTVAGSTRYYEGQVCGVTDLQGTDALNFTIPPGADHVYSGRPSDGDGGVTVSLHFINESQQTI